MTYSPQNKTVFTAAYSGALGGIGAALKTPTDPVPTDPGVVSIADVAGAFAQSFDTVWGAVTPSELDVLSIEEVSAAYFIGSAPPNAPPFNVPANWTAICEALVAIVKAGENYFASQRHHPRPVEHRGLGWNRGHGGHGRYGDRADGGDRGHGERGSNRSDRRRGHGARSLSHGPGHGLRLR